MPGTGTSVVQRKTSRSNGLSLTHQAERPLLLTGSGILWSGAEVELQQFAELAGIPFYTTPQGRGVIPDDHALSFPAALT